MGGAKGHGSFKNPKSKKPSVGGGGGATFMCGKYIEDVCGSVGRSVGNLGTAQFAYV